MLVQADTSVTITDTVVVEFFTKFKDNQSLQDGFEELARSYCRTMTVAMDLYHNSADSERDEGVILAYMKSMEKRFDDTIASHALTSCEALANVTRSIDAIPGQINGQMMALVSTVDNAVRGSMEKLNIGCIAANVSSAVKEWLSADIKTLCNGQDAIKGDVQALETRLKESLQTQVSDPFKLRVDRLQDVVKSLPHEVLTLWSASTTEHESKERLHDRLQELRTRLDEAVSFQQAEIKQVQRSFADIGSNVKKMTNDVSGKAFTLMIKNIFNDTIKQLEQQTQACVIAVKGSQDRLSHIERDMASSNGVLSQLQKSGDGMAAKVDSLLVKASSNSLKGAYGEQRLFSELCDTLTDRDGYEIDIVSGVPHQCDISIRKLGFPEIRVESKAHGQNTGQKVRTNEVKRFQSDLTALNMHGIMVSLHSGIVGKGSVEVEQLRNGKFAIYLSNNQYDMEQIHDMVRLLYSLDKFTSKDGDDDGALLISADTLHRAQMIISSMCDKIKVTKTHLKESITLLNDLSLDLLQKLLNGNDGDDSEAVKAPEVHQCPYCDKTFSSSRGVALHINKAHPTRNIG